MVGAVFLGALRFTFAQCPEICDGSSNTGFGNGALDSNLVTDNTGIGYFALATNTVGLQNTATGSNALFSNGSGGDNTATGYKALGDCNAGSHNTAVGSMALRFVTNNGTNTAVGYSALLNTTGAGNIALGAFAGGNVAVGSSNIEIGNNGANNDAGRIRIGTKGTHQSAFIAGISGVTVANGVGVVVNNQGQLGTLTSSACYKEAIKPMDKASEAILSLEPVTFRYKHDLDPDRIPQFGLVAEQVEKVNPDLVARDEQGKPYTVRYEAVNAMLLNEFLKEHKRVQEQTETNLKQDATIAQQQKEIQTLTEALKAQAEQLQKVSDQLKTQRTPRVVNN